jgi:methyl-accepting chemotaxis protein
MALPDEYTSGLGIYSIGLDAAGLSQRHRVWAVLEPCLAGALEDHFRATIANSPFYAKVLAANRGPYEAMIVNHTRLLFTTPIDEAWVAAAINRVKTEIDLGYDMRARGAVTQGIVSGLNKALAATRFMSRRKAFELSDLALRVLQFDAAVGIVFHYQARVNDAKKQGRELAKTIEDFRSSMLNIRKTSQDAIASAGDASDKLAQLADTAAAEFNAAAEAAKGTVANVSTIATATEELTAAGETILSQAHETVRMADEAVRQGAQTNEAIQSLTATADAIESIVGVISGIAAHTNLLALNATIEAARAGEAGRGFAIVASEVKQLAAQTTKATRDIAEKIAQIQAATQRSVADIAGAGRTAEAMAAIAKSVARSVNEQTQATAGITAAASEAADNARALGHAVDVAGEAIRNAREAARVSLDFSRQVTTNTRQVGAAMDTLFQSVSSGSGVKELPQLVKEPARIGR